MIGETPAGVILLLHLAATLYMTGLVWFVQAVHYPLFAQVGEAQFPLYQRGHLARTGPVVAPVMIAEAATGALLLVWTPPQVPFWAACAGAVLLALVWLSTFLLQVPEHRRLEQGFHRAAHHRLVRSNRLRTTAWTLRAALVLWMVSA